MNKHHTTWRCTLQAGIVINAITEKYLFGWRVSLSVMIFVGSFLALGALFLPETPRHVEHEVVGWHYFRNYTVYRFLAKKHKYAKALKVLIKIHQDHSKAQSELAEIKSYLRDSVSQKDCFQTVKYFCSGRIIQRWVSLSTFEHHAATIMPLCYILQGVHGLCSDVDDKSYWCSSYCVMIIGARMPDIYRGIHPLPTAATTLYPSSVKWEWMDSLAVWCWQSWCSYHRWLEYFSLTR